MTNREKLIELLCKAINIVSPCICCDGEENCEEINHAIDYLIANGVAMRENGKWVWDECDGEDWFGNPTKVLLYCTCSICKKGVRQKYFLFCPYCGAKMDWEE